MQRRHLSTLAVALVGSMAFIAAGCGGSKKASTTTTAARTSTEAVMTTTAAATTTAASPTTTAASSTTTAAASGLGALATSANCAKLADLGQAFASAFAGTNGDIEKSAALLKQFADKTPADIRPDFQTVAAAFQKIADALKGMKPGQAPDAATLAKLGKLSSEIDQAALKKASDRITAWAQKNCNP